MFFFTFVTSYSIYIVVVVNIYVRDKVRKKKNYKGKGGSALSQRTWTDLWMELKLHSAYSFNLLCLPYHTVLGIFGLKLLAPLPWKPIWDVIRNNIGHFRKYFILPGSCCATSFFPLLLVCKDSEDKGLCLTPDKSLYIFYVNSHLYIDFWHKQ